jgi:predicted Kef-type K+ transport protein
LAALALVIKPVVFQFLLRKFSERSRLAWDAGLRLGQISEFSLLIAFVATSSGMIGEAASLVIQGAAIVTFLVSSYIVVMYCPTPIASNPKLRRD